MELLANSSAPHQATLGLHFLAEGKKMWLPIKVDGVQMLCSFSVGDQGQRAQRCHLLQDTKEQQGRHAGVNSESFGRSRTQHINSVLHVAILLGF